jgi:hypothetical protein
MRIKLIFLILNCLFVGCSENDKIAYPKGVDYESLIDHGEYLTDNDKVYRKYVTSDETLILEIESVDRNSFVSIDNSIYGKDKFHVFVSRSGILEQADVKSFQIVKSSDGKLYGKEKNSYYFWDQIVLDSNDIIF